jgi:phage gp45-like
MNMIRGIVNAVTEGFIKLFSAAGRYEETIEEREYFQHYGFTSRPLPDAELIIINEGNHYIAVASDDRRYRLAVENGEVALYTDEGDKIHLKRDKTIEIISGNKLVATVENEVDITTKTANITASESCTVTSPVVKAIASASCEVESPVILLGSQSTTRYLVDERFITTYNTHTHNGGHIPDQQIVAANACTSIVKGA